MTLPKIIRFPEIAAEKKSDLFFENHLLSSDLFYEVLLKKAGPFAIITQDNLAPLFGERLLKELKNRGAQAHLLTFPTGENFKNRQTKENLEDALLALGLQRDVSILALGGGVVLDMAAFVAATYMRGVRFISIPTTLLAMGDAAMGGKCALNTRFGKNQIGAIYPPESIFIDTDFIKTLSDKEINNGLVEMGKHFVMEDRLLFMQFASEKNIKEAIDPYLVESCKIKIRIVEKDPLDNSWRRLLNFGHTVGHALESSTKYSLSHGEAVAFGIIAECALSKEMGLLPAKSYQLIADFFSRFIPKKASLPLSIEEMVGFMKKDKKNTSGKICSVLLEDMGKVHLKDGCIHPIEEKLLEKVLGDLQKEYLC